MRRRLRDCWGGALQAVARGVDDIDMKSGPTPEPVSQLVYLSRATAYVDRSELHDITAVSMANNRGRGITGALLFCDGYFLQILEGAPEVVDATLEKICLDARHADVQVIERRDGVARMFAGWDMSCLHEAVMSDAQRARALACVRLIGRDELVDRIGNDAHQLLVELQNAIVAESDVLLSQAA